MDNILLGSTKAAQRSEKSMPSRIPDLLAEWENGVDVVDAGDCGGEYSGIKASATCAQAASTAFTSSSFKIAHDSSRIPFSIARMLFHQLQDLRFRPSVKRDV